MPYYGKNVVYKFRRTVGFPVYALFLQDCKKNNVNLPRAFRARYKACAALWKRTMVGKVKAAHYARAKKIVYKRRIPLGRNFKGVVPYYPRTFATYVQKMTKGTHKSTDLKKLAAEYHKMKAQKK